MVDFGYLPKGTGVDGGFKAMVCCMLPMRVSIIQQSRVEVR